MKFLYKKIKMYLPDAASWTPYYKAAMLIIAVISISIATSKHNITKAENTPAVRTEAIMDSERQSSGIFLENKGLTPIIIKSVSIYDRLGNQISNNSAALNEHFSLLEHRFTIDPIKPRDAIKQGDTHWLIRSKVNTPIESVIVRDFLEGMSIDVCFCSLTNMCENKTIGLKKHPSKECK